MRGIKFFVFLASFLFGLSLFSQINLQEKIYDAIKKVNPSVMEIHNNEAKVLGSGFYVGEGLIVTNKHVIASDKNDRGISDDLTAINPFTKKKYKVVTVYPSQFVDFAILKFSDLSPSQIKQINITEAKLGNSDNIQLGEFVIAIGSPLGYQSSVTFGNISGLYRFFDFSGYSSEEAKNKRKVFIQIDAVVNHGNSGGPLANLSGEIIGINTLGAYDREGTKSGLNFSIPINMIKPSIDNIKNGKDPFIPMIGFNTHKDSINEEVQNESIEKVGLSPGAIQLKFVEKQGPLYKAGVQVNDIINSVNGQSLQGLAHLTYYINSCNWKDALKLNVYRISEGKYYDFNVIVGRQLSDDIQNKILNLNSYSSLNNKIIKIGLDIHNLVNINNIDDYINNIRTFYQFNDLNKIWILREGKSSPEKMSIN